MWCSTCQQDVPGLGSPGKETLLRCGKCGESLAAPNPQSASASGTATSAVSAPPPTASDGAALNKMLRQGPLGDEDWEIEAELRGVQRLLRSLKSRSTLVAEPAIVHGSHRAPSAWHAASHDPHTAAADSAHSLANAPGPNEATQQPRGPVAAWTTLSIGLATFACGAVLLVWSLVTPRDDLWRIAIPMVLIGQAGLIIGLILQFDGLWHTSHRTARALSQLDGELKHVRHATALLSAPHTGSAERPAQLSLADLKGQIELLAQQMPRHTP
jgi:hypothetical protein